MPHVEARHIGISPPKSSVFREDFGVQQKAEQFVASNTAPNFLFQCLLSGTEIDWF